MVCVYNNLIDILIYYDWYKEETNLLPKSLFTAAWSFIGDQSSMLVPNRWAAVSLLFDKGANPYIICLLLLIC